VSVSQDIIYRRAINERVNHLMHVHNMFLVLNQLTKNEDINVFKYIKISNRFPWNWTISWRMNKCWTKIR